MFSSWKAGLGVFCSAVLQYGWPRLAFVQTAGLGWLVFSRIAGRLAQANLCSIMLQDSWPGRLVFSGIAGRLAYVACVQ